MTEDEMILSVSKQLSIPIDIVKKAYRSQYKFILDKIRDLPLDINMSKDEFDLLKTNFSLMDIGKLYCTWDSLQKRKRYYKEIRPRLFKNKNKENEQSSK
jgi:hypothetical protein